MDTQREQALNKLKADMARERETTWDMMRFATRWTDQDRHNSGYGRYTREQAIVVIFEKSLERLEKMMRAYERQFPD